MPTTPQKFALIIGGTGFISQYCVEELHSAGFTVATMNRGSSIDLHGDKVSYRFVVNCRRRKEFVKALDSSITTMKSAGFDIPDNAWDLVIDFICYEPPHAEDCAQGLNGNCKLFVMISTDSIYEVCTRPSYLETPFSTTPPLVSSINHHPGRREEDQSLLPISDAELRRKDEYGLEKLQCEQIFLKASNESLSRSPNLNQYPYPFQTVWLRLPDVTGERELPRSRHYQLQMRIQLGLPVYIDPESNKFDVDTMKLPSYYDPIENNDNDKQSKVINQLPADSIFPKDAVKLSFVHARDVSRAIISCHQLQQLALQEGVNTNNMDDCNSNDKRYSKSWEIIRNSGVNIGSLEQVTLLEYLYLIGNTLGKPVFVYSSSDGRESLLRQNVKALTDQNAQDKQQSFPPQQEQIPLNRIYPKSYHQLYLEYHAAHFDSVTNGLIEANKDTAPTTPSQGLEAGRPNIQFFTNNSNNTTSPETRLQQLKINHSCPRPEYRGDVSKCFECEGYLPSDSYSHQQSQGNWMTEWQKTEGPSGFTTALFDAGYECPLESSSDSSDSSSDDDTSADDSDYDLFFQGNYAKGVTAPLLEKITKDEKFDKSKLSTRKGKIIAVVKRVLSNPNNKNSNTTNNTPKFDPTNLSHMRILHLLERLETSDQCSYLPSVTQGPISIQKAINHLPNWYPTCLYAWATKQTIWYNTSIFMNSMDADPRNTLWRLDQRWGKYFE